MGRGNTERKQTQWATIPRLWDGELAACIACGPSLDPQDIEAIEGRAKTIVINDAYRIAGWADLLYACDAPWWDRFAQDHLWEVDGKQWAGALNFKGHRVTQDAGAAYRWGLIHVEGKKGEGISLDPTYIHTGNNSGLQALNLAALLGARRIVLLGYDMGRTGGRAHWFGDHPAGLQKRTPFDRCIPAFEEAAPMLAVAGVEVVNASRETALTCFPRQPIKEALR